MTLPPRRGTHHASPVPEVSVSPEALSRGRVITVLSITVFLALAAYYFVGVPAAIGHTFTITTRGHLYLTMVACSLILLGAAVYLAHRLSRRFTMTTSVVLSAIAFLAVYGVLIGLLPSLGDLSANVAASNQFGYARAATETPQPIVNILSTPLIIDGKTIAPGQIVYPGFDADVLWKFRWYSLLNQLLIWTVIALVFGALLERFLQGRTKRKKQKPAEQTAPTEEPVPAA